MQRQNQNFLQMNFSDALTELKGGNVLYRDSWPMHVIYCVEHRPVVNKDSYDMSLLGNNGIVPYGTYIAEMDAYGNAKAWKPTQEDLFAEDWDFADGYRIVDCKDK